MTEKPKKKKIFDSAVALVVSAGILIGGVFNSPADLTHNKEKILPEPAPIVELIAPDTDPGDDGDGEEEVCETERKKKGFRARARELILRLPVAVRAVVGVPLWCVGWVAIGGASLLWRAALSPVLGAVLRWICVALILAAIVLAVLKLCFPQLKLKEILNKKRVLFILIGSAALMLADMVMTVAGAEAIWVRLVRCTGSFGILAGAVLPALIKYKNSEQIITKECV